MAVRARVAGSGTLVAWKVPWPDVFLTEERLLSAVSPLGDMVGHARSYHTCQSSHGGELTRPELHFKSWVWCPRNSPDFSDVEGHPHFESRPALRVDALDAALIGMLTLES